MKRLLLLLMLPVTFTVNAQNGQELRLGDQCLCGMSLVGKDHKLDTDHGNIIVSLTLYDEGLSFRKAMLQCAKAINGNTIDSTEGHY